MPGPEYREILQSILELSPDLIAVSAFSGEVLYLNPAGRSLVGVTGDAGNCLTADFFTPDALRSSADVEGALRSRGRWEGRTELRHFVTGEAIPVAVSAFVIRSRGGEPSAIASIVRDRRRGERRDQRLRDAVVSAEHHAAEQRALAELSKLAVDAELAVLMDATVSAAAITSEFGTAIITRVDASESLVLEAGAGPPTADAGNAVDPDSLIGATIFRNEVVVCTDRASETRFGTSAMAEYGMCSGAGVPISDSETVWGALTVYSRKAREYGESDLSFLRAVAGVLSTAVRRVDLDTELRRRSKQDALTGLPNRELAYEYIDDALRSSREANKSVAVMLLDIDDFKVINDSLGHEAGDFALIRFARRLASATRGTGTVARLGGDEFLIVYDGVDDEAHARELARHVTEAIAAPYPADSGPTPLSASIGIAVSERHSNRRQLIHRADLAMYRAKDIGSGGHAVFDQDDVYDAERVRTLSIDLRAALAHGDLTMVYQPLVDIATGRIVAMEGLARWHHALHGEVNPTEFVAVAERTGLATELGMWSLTTACNAAARWREFTDVTVRVNVSALQLRNSEFPSRVAAVLAETGLEPKALGLEITETVWVSDTARVSDTLAALHDMGVALLLDDLGKGHSSISYLDKYPVFECFKIDKSFVATLPGERPQAIVSAIVALAKAFDVTVVGEGVESPEQLDALRACGCDMAQGFLLGRPAPLDKTMALLGEGSIGR